MAVVDPEQRGVDLQPRTLARVALAAAAIVVTASLAGYLVASLGPTVHAARSEVVYELDAERPTGFLRQDRQLTTQLVTIRSRAVVGPVAEANELTFEDLSRKLEVGIVDDSEVIRIDIRDGSASRARTLVDGITGEYLSQVRPNGAAEARRYLEAQLEELGRRQEALFLRMAELPPAVTPPVEQALMTTEMQNLLFQRVALESRLDELTVEELRAPQVAQIASAHVLADPVSPRPRRAAAAGGVAGLLVAAIAVAVLARRHWSVHREA